jgi:hypothetical protein
MARSNDAAAQMLQEFAELLAISGGEGFKVRAYEKAARALAGCPAEISGLDEKALCAIPGVGGHLARKIIEFCDTGSVQELDELRGHVPAGLRTLLTVPGLGPRRARQVYDEPGIASVSELLGALHDQRLRTLRGWGERSEANLAQAIHDAQSSGGRLHLDVALDLAQELVGELTALPSVRMTTEKMLAQRRQLRDLERSNGIALLHGTELNIAPDGSLAAAARTGTALEINSFPDRLDLDDELIHRARRVGVRFAIDTDAHAVPHLGYLRFGVATAQRGWAEASEVINTYPLDKLRRFLAHDNALIGPAS